MREREDKVDGEGWGIEVSHMYSITFMHKIQNAAEADVWRGGGGGGGGGRSITQLTSSNSFEVSCFSVAISFSTSAIRSSLN